LGALDRKEEMKYAIGGIGDFIQFSESAIKEKCIYVCTHQGETTTEQFFDRLDVKTVVKTFSSTQELNSNSQLAFMQQLDRTPFPDKSIFLSKFSNTHNTNKKVLGIHHIGSNFSNNYWATAGKPLKLIPDETIVELTEAFPDYDTYIFGKQNEIDHLRSKVKAKFISEDNIWDVFSYVATCSIFIGVDSAFKTLSCVLGIPTLLLLGDYTDDFRDNNFVNPYVSSGIMDIYRFCNLLDKKERKEIIELVNKIRNRENS
jgi:ADP-heptose:LPS heptosyltransferase